MIGAFLLWTGLIFGIAALIGYLAEKLEERR